MSIRAKFRLFKYETTRMTPNGRTDKVEIRTLFFSAVYDGSEENEKFFAFTPSGEIRLGVVNPVAWKQFELDKEYYIDFSPSE